ncbi:uncharacterized protein SCHCODRAFT_02614389 [Schizophyllum commune H4-8]|nr:uncharacterized protein SCHCODRAFT_02614389 [Schizophyllum commune H4-8]KAI5896265.1 hypothetical protein SCHCODRAFT_02614389 [Schizophyllum commune H4-8]
MSKAASTPFKIAFPFKKKDAPPPSPASASWAASNPFEARLGQSTSTTGVDASGSTGTTGTSAAGTSGVASGPATTANPSTSPTSAVGPSSSPTSVTRPPLLSKKPTTIAFPFKKMKEPALVLDQGSTPASIRARPASPSAPPSSAAANATLQPADSGPQPTKLTSSASSPVVTTQPAKAAALSPSATHPAILAASASADALATFATHPAVLATSPPATAPAPATSTSVVASTHKSGTYPYMPRTAPAPAPPPKPLFTRKKTATAAASAAPGASASASSSQTASTASTSNTAHPPQALTFKHLQVVYKLENDGTWTCRLCAALSKTRKFGKDAKLPELADHVKDVHPLAANELSGVRNWELTEMRGRLGLGVARK